MQNWRDTLKELRKPPQKDDWTIEGYLRLGLMKKHLNDDEVELIIWFLSHPKVRKAQQTTIRNTKNV
jgi:hypothetical protein